MVRLASSDPPSDYSRPFTFTPFRLSAFPPFSPFSPFRPFRLSAVSFPCDLPAQTPLRILTHGTPRPARRGGGDSKQRARAARTHRARREHVAHPHVRRARDGDVRPERAGLAL